MKKLTAMFLSLLMVISFVLPVSAFSTVKVTGIKLNPTKVVLKVGQTTTLKVTLIPSKTTQKALTFVTSNKNVATIDKTGKITAVGAGSTTISVLTAAKNVSAKCTVTVSKPSTYTITALFPGDTPNDFDKVLAQAEKLVANTLNVKLDFQFVPWADYGNKVMVKMTAGDNLDLHLNAPWLSMNQMISNKLIQPWDTYLTKEGQAVTAAFPKAMIDNNRFEGKIYGIPLGNTLSAAKGGQIPIRGDLRKKYGMAPITSLADLEKYFLKVKENEKGMVPLTWNASTFSFIGIYAINSYQFGQNNANVIVPFNNDGSVTISNIKPIYEYPEFINQVKLMNKWYNEGIIDKDVMAQKDGKGAYLSGKAASSNVDWVEEASLVAGGVMEKTDIYPTIKPVSDFKMWNFLCLNTKSKNADRVVQWYNWIFADQANYDLLQYGIKNVHWVDTGKGTYDLPKGIDANKNYTFPGYVLLWNPNFDRVAMQSSAASKAENKFTKNASNYVQSALTGFNPNYDNLKDEIAKVSAIWPEVIYTLTAGIKDPDTGLAEAKTKLEAAGYLKIVDEAKKQVSEFIAKK